MWTVRKGVIINGVISWVEGAVRIISRVLVLPNSAMISLVSNKKV